MKLDMAKEISMIQRTPRGKQAYKYFDDIEKARVVAVVSQQLNSQAKATNEPTINSREVAEMVGKRHANVIADIRTIIGHLSNELNFQSVKYFVESTYIDGKGERRKCYELTKKGCELFATPQVIEWEGQRVLTSAQLAESYGTDTERIKINFNRNKHRYLEGKHYIRLVGEDLRKYKTKYQKDTLSNRINTLYLWTEKGAWLHAKSLNTDRAWDAYEMLVDEYYRLAAQVQAEQPKLPTNYKEALLALVEQARQRERQSAAASNRIQPLQTRATTIFAMSV